MTTALLLHGNLCDARMWRPPLVATLEAHGIAVRFPDLVQPTIAAMAAHAIARVDGRVLPIGFSMGAIVAVEIARVAAGRLAGLVLIGSNLTADLPDRAAARHRHQARVRGGGLAGIVDAVLVPAFFDADPPPTELVELVRTMAADTGVAGFVAQSEALRTRTDLRPVLPSIAAPTFVVVGAADRVCPPPWSREWARIIPGARLAIVEHAGHMLPLERPEELARLLDEWLATAVAGTA